MKMSTSALPSISTTGSSTVNSVMPKDGAVARRRRIASASGRPVAAPRPSRTCRGRRRRPSVPASLPNSGPATMIVGIATATPSARVRPEVGAEQVDGGQRAGVRRHEAVHRRKAGQRRDSDGDQRQLRAARHQVDDRHQQHEADLEEHRQADDRADQRHRPRQRPRRGVPDDGVDDLVGAAGVGEQLGEHRAERDQDADAGGGVAEPVGERLEHVLQVLAGDDADRQRAEDQRQERVQLDDR